MIGWQLKPDNKYSIQNFTSILFFPRCSSSQTKRSHESHLFPLIPTKRHQKSTRPRDSFSTISRNFKDPSLYPKRVFKKSKEKTYSWTFLRVWLNLESRLAMWLLLLLLLFFIVPMQRPWLVHPRFYLNPKFSWCRANIRVNFCLVAEKRNEKMKKIRCEINFLIFFH